MDFQITTDHLKLLQRMYVSWEDCEYGAPTIDCKRPYGNSDVEEDICEILGWPNEARNPDYEPTYSQQQRNQASTLHVEMEQVLQIVLTTQIFVAGNYTREDYKPWRLA